MTELELKFLLDEEGERRLRKHAALRRMTRGRAQTSTLLSVYHDTDDWRLREARIALRLRRKGDRWVQTVKIGRSLAAGLSNVREIEAEVEGDGIDLEAISDPAVRDLLLTTLAGKPFGPVARTEIKRTKRLLEHGGSVIEFALDHGDIVAGDRRKLLREAELELVEGDVRALFDAAATIFAKGLIHFSERSKADRCYLLATEGRILPAIGLRKARTARITAEMTTDAALQTIVAECLEQIGQNAQLVLIDDGSDGPHQFRIGLRRLRSALRLLPRDSIPPRLTRLIEEAQRLGLDAGRLRDLDVMREDVLAPASASLPARGVAALDKALKRRGQEARKSLREKLVDARTQRFLLEVSAAAAAGLKPRRSGDLGADHLKTPIGETMTAALDRNWRRVEKRAKGISSHDIEARHELRKALKTMRYSAEFAAPLFDPSRIKPFVTQMRALQDVFGELNDLAMAEELLLGKDAPAANDGNAQLAAGLLIGAARIGVEHSWAGAKSAWKALKKTGPFWH